MNTEVKRGDPFTFNRWVKATTLGWLIGFVLVVVLAIAWDQIGGRAQFMVGVGMGAGVGFMQARVLGECIESAGRWIWATTLGMGLPFVLWILVRPWVSRLSSRSRSVWWRAVCWSECCKASCCGFA